MPRVNRTEGCRLLNLKSEDGHRQVDIARAVRRTEPTVYAWLQGRSIPDVPSAVALRRQYGIPEEAWTQPAKRKAS